MKCCNCDQLLVRDSCGTPYRPASAADHQRLYQPECPVLCPACEEVLRCRRCGAVYSGADEEYGGPE
jgi:hypothetical protein